ncbi:hypothetical protein HGRIS_003882 [Hohenbuehelia grisea]|uniref:Phosphatidylglycerol lysyltransferase C-terminal domain-containing protein n=1 Tax=Hohenbuehelia grisea TaxID=104357 RepID=A0ABR3JGT8_9AGAR
MSINTHSPTSSISSSDSFSSLESPPDTPTTPPPETDTPFDKSTIADLVAEYGSSSASAWLEFDRYKIWRPAEPVAESTFLPVQGYMRRDPYVFAWGNPLVSSPAALLPTARAFAAWAEGQGLRPVWACVDHDLEVVLGGSPFSWCTVNCIYEDVVDPAHVVEITSDAYEKRRSADGQGLPSHLKDLRKNLRRAEKARVAVHEVKHEDWIEADRQEIEAGIVDWRKHRHGLQLASTSLQPWLDEKHRRYWVAHVDKKVVGFIILTPIKGSAYQIKNCISFPSAPKGTSEALISTALADLHKEQQARASTSPEDRITVTFGITASDKLKPIENLSGWKVNALAKTYGQVAKGTGLLRRGDFRNKFESEHDPMYVCYPDGRFGLHGVEALLKLLRK